MEKIGLGQLCMTATELYDMTPRQFFNKYDGWTDHQRWLQKEEYERMRLHATAMLQVYVKKGKELKPRDVFKFEWDAGDGFQRRVHQDREEAERDLKKLGIKGKLLHSADW